MPATPTNASATHPHHHEKSAGRKEKGGVEVLGSCILESEGEDEEQEVEFGALPRTPGNKSSITFSSTATATPVVTTTTSTSTSSLRPTPLNITDRPKSFGIFSHSKKRSVTGPLPDLPTSDSSRQLNKPLSLGNLRRAVSGAVRPKAHVDGTRVKSAGVAPSAWANGSGNGSLGTAMKRSGTGVGPRAAVAPTIHSHGTIADQVRGVEDEESRRLSEMAFLG